MLPFPSCPDRAQWLQAWGSDQADLDLDPGPTTYSVTEGKLLDLSELYALFTKWSCPQGTNKPAVCGVHNTVPGMESHCVTFCFSFVLQTQPFKGEAEQPPPESISIYARMAPRSWGRVLRAVRAAARSKFRGKKSRDPLPQCHFCSGDIGFTGAMGLQRGQPIDS